tara:strand:- start:17958 stop:18824 length:867 start_codon:yes stop_codon:yes gene_type:complete
MATYAVRKGQSIYDIAAEKYGDISGVSMILKDNPTISLGTYLTVGMEIEVNSNQSTILNNNIVNFFKSKTITNTDNEEYTESLIKMYNFGDIITTNSEPITYIDDVMWALDNQISMINEQDPLTTEGKFNYDRIRFNNQFDLNKDGDSLSIYFNYNDFFLEQDKWLLIGNSITQQERVEIHSSGTVVLYDSNGDELVISPNTMSADTDIEIVITCNIDSLTQDKTYTLNSNGVFTESLNANNISMSMNMIGGIVNGGDGLNGNVKRLEYNGDVYLFNEGNGTHIFKGN